MALQAFCMLAIGHLDCVGTQMVECTLCWFSYCVCDLSSFDSLFSKCVRRFGVY